MRPDFAPVIAAIRARLDRAATAFRSHRPWLQLGVPAVLALAGGVLVGQAALARAEALGQEAESTLEVWQRVRRWSDHFQPAAAPESASWRESERTIAGFAPERLDALGTASLVASRAEEMGIRDVRIRLEPTDTLQLPDAAAAGPWTVEPGAAAISVELGADLDGLVAFLGVLPPQVTVSRISLDSRSGERRARALLLVQQVRAQP